jgi:Leu/Phe-tRNA-protein transferase
VPLIDCQMPSPHLASLGSRSLPRARFEAELSTLTNAVNRLWRGADN